MTQATKIPWDDVQLFLSLVRTRRLSATGEALGFDTSTASRRLTRLEAELDLPLFDRTREGGRGEGITLHRGGEMGSAPCEARPGTSVTVQTGHIGDSPDRAHR